MQEVHDLVVKHLVFLDITIHFSIFFLQQTYHIWINNISMNLTNQSVSSYDMHLLQ